MYAVINEEVKKQDATTSSHILETIKRLLLTRAPPSNKEMVRAVSTHIGGITKAFTNLDQLANYVYRKYGTNWESYVGTLSKDGYPTKHHGSKTTLGPDVQVIFPFIGHFRHNNIDFTVFNSPHDGSCMYHSVSAVLQPIMLENTPSAEGLKKSL